MKKDWIKPVVMPIPNPTTEQVEALEKEKAKQK
jgi:hypothetical protein